MQHWEFVVGAIMVIVFIAAIVAMLFFSSAHKLGTTIKENIVMSQWGNERSFSIDEDGGYISVTPHVAGPTWEPLRGEHLIDDLLVHHSTTSDAIANKKLDELKQQWIGRPYGEWGVAVGTASGSSMTRMESSRALKPGDKIIRIATGDIYVVAIIVNNVPIVTHTTFVNESKEWALIKEGKG